MKTTKNNKAPAKGREWPNQRERVKVVVPAWRDQNQAAFAKSLSDTKNEGVSNEGVNNKQVIPTQDFLTEGPDRLTRIRHDAIVRLTLAKGIAEVLPNGYQQNGIFYPTLPVDSTLYILSPSVTNYAPIKPWPVADIRPEIYFHWASGKLALVSKAVSNLVVGEKLFYKNNVFSFLSAEHMIKYLGSITPERRKAIKSINFTLDAGPGFPCPRAAILMLGGCPGLKHITVDASLLFRFFAKPNANSCHEVPGMDMLLALRNLDTFKLVIGGNDDEPYNFHANVHLYARSVQGGVMTVTAEMMQAVDLEVAGVENQIWQVVCSRGPYVLNVSEEEIEFGMAEIKILRRYDSPPFTITNSS
ncbi:hypothetical protein DL95DRAFT_466052 [Leptodontidium sp. 2 PMI_412]|nr:hypothetical protein DL95DRAFT_466052 [Leptodontidium sp. 2 PMI_412]